MIYDGSFDTEKWLLKILLYHHWTILHFLLFKLEFNVIFFNNVSLYFCFYCILITKMQPFTPPPPHTHSHLRFETAKNYTISHPHIFILPPTPPPPPPPKKERIQCR